jgi:hypothetical protein
MNYRETRELATLRQSLRERLVAQDPDGARAPLRRLREVAGADIDLRAEYERWSFRFDLLPVAPAAWREPAITDRGRWPGRPGRS